MKNLTRFTIWPVRHRRPAYQGKAAIMTTKTCVFGAINMLELAKKHNATILQTSTSEVYGEPLVHPQVETYRGNVNPNGIRACYDEGKRCAESLFFDYWREEGVDIKVIRIFNTYGPNMDPQDGRVVSNFICQAAARRRYYNLRRWFANPFILLR